MASKSVLINGNTLTVVCGSNQEHVRGTGDEVGSSGSNRFEAELHSQFSRSACPRSKPHQPENHKLRMRPTACGVDRGRDPCERVNMHVKWQDYRKHTHVTARQPRIKTRYPLTGTGYLTKAKCENIIAIPDLTKQQIAACPVTRMSEWITARAQRASSD